MVEGGLIADKINKAKLPEFGRTDSGKVRGWRGASSLAIEWTVL